MITGNLKTKQREHWSQWPRTKNF